MHTHDQHSHSLSRRTEGERGLKGVAVGGGVDTKGVEAGGGGRDRGVKVGGGIDTKGVEVGGRG
jgi:hypothetical protein